MLAGGEPGQLAGRPAEIRVRQSGVELVGVLRIELTLDVEGEVLEKRRLEAEAESADAEVAVIVGLVLDVGQVELEPTAQVEALKEGVPAPFVEPDGCPEPVVGRGLDRLVSRRRGGQGQYRRRQGRGELRSPGSAV